MTDRVRVDFVLVEVLGPGGSPGSWWKSWVLVEVLVEIFRVAASDPDPMGPVGQHSSSGRNRG
jgi:hypothetical protein